MPFVNISTQQHIMDRGVHAYLIMIAHMQVIAPKTYASACRRAQRVCVPVLYAFMVNSLACAPARIQVLG